MPATVFWDVDTQHDFVMPDGRLYAGGAEEILSRLESLTQFARDRRIPILGSVDYHAETDEEISDQPDFLQTWPPHCLRGTPGQEKVPATRPRDPLWIDNVPENKDALKRKVREHLERGGEVIFRKQRFDVYSNPNVATVLDAVRPDRVVVYGVALDLGGRYAIDGLLGRKRYRVALVRDATRAVRREEGETLIESWAARGVAVLTTDQVIGGALGI